jgi:hypothetical protein
MAPYDPEPMPSDPWLPVEGRCNARRTDKTGLCRNKPEPNHWRCKHHGGRCTGPKTPEGKAKVSKNSLTHGLYASLLADTLSADDRKVWDEMSAAPDLGPELKLARLRLARIARVRAEIAKKDGTLTDEEKTDLVRRIYGRDVKDAHSLDWEALEQTAAHLVRRLALAQRLVNPGAKASGNFKVRLDVSKEAQVAADEDVPDLVAHDDPEEIAGRVAAEADQPAAEKAPDVSSKFDGLDE